MQGRESNPDIFRGTLAPPEEDGGFSTVCFRITPDLDVLLMGSSLLDYIMGWE